VSPAQRSFIDAYVNAQSDLSKLNQSILSTLAALPDNSPNSQVDAAIALIRMNVTPVVAIHIPFGGDNHHDSMYQNEASQTITGVATLDYMLGQLKQYTAVDGRCLSDAVTVVSLNVFGRTLAYDTQNGDGRQHNQNHQVSFVIGAPFKGGLFGGLAPVGGDFGALPIDSMTGAGSSSGDIAPVDTLSSFAQTVAAGVGVDPKVISQNISNEKFGLDGKGTDKIVPAALA
jgi:hypothetical protein